MICVSFDLGFNWTITDAGGTSVGNFNSTSAGKYVIDNVGGTAPYKVEVSLPQLSQPLVATGLPADALVAVIGNDQNPGLKTAIPAT